MQVSTLEERIQAIDGEILEVKKQIEECDANITIATSEQMRGYWIEEKKQLRRKEEQLREEKTELLKRLPTPGASALPSKCSSHRDAPGAALPFPLPASFQRRPLAAA